MNDSDAVDEAEAAKQAAHDEANGVGHYATTEQLISFGRNLFFWEHLGDYEDSYINLDNVTVVNVRGERLIVKCGDEEAWTESPETIERFWAEWEII